MVDKSSNQSNLFQGNSKTIFVVNGQVVNGVYSYVSDMTFVPDIKNIKILMEASDLTLYGMRAANGVIEINTKN